MYSSGTHRKPLNTVGLESERMGVEEVEETEGQRLQRLIVEYNKKKNTRNGRAELIVSLLVYAEIFAFLLIKDPKAPDQNKLVIWQDLIIVILSFVIGTVIRKHIIERCPHGVYKGDEIHKQICKCPQCNENYMRIQLEKKVNLEYKNKKEQERLERIKKEYERKRQLEEDYKKEYSAAESMKRNILLSSIKTVEALDPFEFEDYIAHLLSILGFEDIVQTPYSNDGGKDIIGTYHGKKYYVECKHYNNNHKISRPALQKLFAAMSEDGIDEGIFFTTSSFSSTATEYGKQHHIKTVDGKGLAKIIAKNVPKKGFPTNYTLPCSKCGERIDFCYLNNPYIKTCSNGHKVKGVFDDLVLFPKTPKNLVMKY